MEPRLSLSQDMAFRKKSLEWASTCSNEYGSKHKIAGTFQVHLPNRWSIGFDPSLLFNHHTRKEMQDPLCHEPLRSHAAAGSRWFASQNRSTPKAQRSTSVRSDVIFWYRMPQYFKIYCNNSAMLELVIPILHKGCLVLSSLSAEPKVLYATNLTKKP